MARRRIVELVPEPAVEPTVEKHRAVEMVKKASPCSAAEPTAESAVEMVKKASLCPAVEPTADPPADQSTPLVAKPSQKRLGRPYGKRFTEGTTVWSVERAPGVRARLSHHVYGVGEFFDYRTELFIDGKWWWTPRGCSFKRHELTAILGALSAFVSAEVVA